MGTECAGCFYCEEDFSSIWCWVTFHTKCSPVFSREVHSVLAVPDCSNQVFAFSFWNKPCGGCSRQVFPCAFKGSVWPSRASVVSKWERWFPLLSCCHLDKGASQSLIIYLMCDAIFPDFWVICATAGCTSRVGGKWERAGGGGGGGGGEAHAPAFRIVHQFPLMLWILCPQFQGIWINLWMDLFVTSDWSVATSDKF